MNPAYLEALRKIAQPIRAAEMPRSLTPMRQLLDALGEPQTQFPSVVVTGSVGKGTTCKKIARILSTPETYADPLGEPMRVGLYTGPHLHSFRERFVVSGQQISQEEFVEAANAVFDAASQLDFAYSTFEMATALVLYWFARQKVNIAVLEVGIGGRWDAVNVVENVLAVFTPIEREHVNMLGGSIQTIAWNKAGIIQPKRGAVSLYQSTEVNEILRLEAEQKDAFVRLTKPGSYIKTVFWLLAENKIIPPVALLSDWLMFQREKLPGRFEQHHINGRWIVIDGGHTEKAAQYLYEGLEDFSESSLRNLKIRMIIGMLRDKSANDFLKVFDLPNFTISLTTAPGHRAFTAQDLAKMADLQHAAMEIVPDLHEALKQILTSPETCVIIAGSLRMAAAAREALGLLSADELAESQATRAIFEGDDYLSRMRPL